MLLYVSGPYSGDVDANVCRAKAIATELWTHGHAVLCPHSNTYKMEEAQISYESFIAGDLMMIARCDGVVMVPGWEESKGARIEHDYAQSLGMPTWIYPDIPSLHLTERRCPQQAKAFAEIVGRIYRTHLSKNADYSPSNILAPGFPGVVTRLWDKIARLMNLTGFSFDVSNPRFEAPEAPKHESIDDTLLDTACYSIIGLLLRQGKWGK